MAPQRTEKFSEDSFYSFVGRVKENKKETGRIEILARAGRLYFQVMQEAVSEHRGKSCEVVPPERSCSAEMRPAFPAPRLLAPTRMDEGLEAELGDWGRRGREKPQ